MPGTHAVLICDVCGSETVSPVCDLLPNSATSATSAPSTDDGFWVHAELQMRGAWSVMS